MVTRSKMWVPWSNGASVSTLAAASVVRVFLMSIVEAPNVLDRNVQQYTVLRHVFNVALRSVSANAVVTMGLIILNRDLLIGSITPALSPTADWLWLDEVPVGSSAGFLPDYIMRHDIRSMRKSQAKGIINELYLYIENRNVASAIDYHFFGRTLILNG